MSATKNRGVGGLSELEILVASKASQAATLILAGNRGDDQSSLRYTDDFIFVHKDSDYLSSLIPKINNFLRSGLKLELHPKKIILRKLIQGVDFLGYIILPYHRVLRTKTKRRMFRKVRENVRNWQAGKISKKVTESNLAVVFRYA